mgnify:FL=1
MRSTRTSAFPVTENRTKEKLPVWAAFFYLTFELQVYMLFVSSGAKHCQSSSISVVSGIGYVSLTLYNLFM